MATFRMQERDLDLFLLEELLSGSGFDEWFAKRIGLKKSRCHGAEHSVSAKSNAKWGETDVLAFFTDDSETVAVLIEDKIAAEFTERQAERYLERADELVKSGRAQRHVIVLVAPAIYLAGVPISDPWSTKISLEELRDWFAHHDTAHANWRTSALTECIARVARSRSAGDAQIREFSKNFARFLRMQPDGPFDHNITGDKWGFIVATPRTPSYVQLAWKPGKRCVDLTFSGPNVGKARSISVPLGIGQHLADGKSLKSDIFRIEVPMVDLSAPFEDQTDVAIEVMAAIWQLLPLVPLVLNTFGQRENSVINP